MKNAILLTAGLALTGCASLRTRPHVCPPCPPCPAPVSTAPVAAAPVIFVPAAKDLPDFSDAGDRARLLKAALLDRAYFRGLKNYGLPYTFAGREVTAMDLAAANEEFIKILQSSPTAADLGREIKAGFDVYELAGNDSTGTVVFSSYYEPTINASLTKTGPYKYPIYAKPPDLITVNLEDFDPKLKGQKITGRVQDGDLVPYLDRDDIDFKGALAGKGLELAWLKSRADLMDLHTEGSARLQLADGRAMKAKFAATNSLKFKGWLSAMVEAGALPRAGISPEKGEKYLEEHPDQARGLLGMDRRYVFFRLEQPADPDEGPQGTYGLPLTGWRSVAVDNAIVPMGALAFMQIEDAPNVDNDGVLLGRKPYDRFVFCQDTGGAIKGPGRVDFFAGNGKKAHTFAFKLWNPGRLYLLLKK